MSSPKSVSNYLNKDPGGKKLVKYLSNVNSESKFIELTGITDPKVIATFYGYITRLYKNCR